ncbi:MAG: sodium-transporting two-sector ATPase [Candidatus Saccharibacteria bacterium]
MLETKTFTKLVNSGQSTAEVISVSDFVANISLLPGAMVHSVILFAGGAEGVVWQINSDSLDILLLNDLTVYANELAVLYKDELRMGVGKSLLGRVINPLGKPVDGKGFVPTKEDAPYFRQAPGFKDRANVEDSLESGVTLVDILFPLAKGQRMAIMGDSKSGKTSFMVQNAIHQAQQGQIVVYVLVSKSRNELTRIVGHFTDAKVMKNIVLVVADTAEPLPVGFLAPYAGCAIAESFWYEGRDVVVVYDDFTNHAKLYREMALLLNQNVGREAYPGDMFHVHSALLERAGKLDKSNSALSVFVSGSTPGNDLTGYQATSLISMSDGQIVFDLDALHGGMRPAINTELSVSRIGGANKVIGNQIKNGLSQAISRFRQAKAMTSFTDQASETSRLELALGLRIFEALQQGNDEFYTFFQQRLMIEVILRTEDPGILDVEWLKGKIRKMSTKKEYSEDDLTQMASQLIKESLNTK